MNPEKEKEENPEERFVTAKQVPESKNEKVDVEALLFGTY